jgi:hypothetical protein
MTCHRHLVYTPPVNFVARSFNSFSFGGFNSRPGSAAV